ncbi:BLUF domain-containing protein [Croceicoccus gelatinilyticus]|uniref:BLUF domain-containing protein n=1 Tax=Croceicoccus gelatinilyticus TaxID=2835536 RepID=UPI001BCDDD86|nr:BLUF domain-containing protein [Croceicoccus gelatinilyticus]
MRQIVYVSAATNPLSDKDVSDIVAKSQFNNAMADVTGFLLFNGTTFMQLVEGPDRAIDKLLDRLYTDKRHHAITVLEDNMIEKRNFPVWTMHHIRLNGDKQHRRETLARNMPIDLKSAVMRVVTNFTTLN